MNLLTKTITGVLIGAFLGAMGVWLLSNTTTDSNEEKPLYWVAPMDPNYKRDKPGKSPMGMDLIPVYEEKGNGKSQGTISINPDVVNNLGVRTVEVKSGDMNNTVQTVGYVQYDEDRLLHIHPRVEGWIDKLYVKAAGEPVIKGQPIYELYAPTLVNAQEELLLALRRKDPILIRAANERLAALQVPQSEIGRVRKTGQVSQTIQVSAPQAGVVDKLMVREGMFVKPGESIMAIAQLDHIWVIGEVFEREASFVSVGDVVRMHLNYLPGREWLGRVDYIYPSLNNVTRTAQVRVHFNNPDSYLKPGMFAQMRIEAKPMSNVLLIPREALIRTGNQSRVVLAMEGGHFKSVAVKVGHINNEQAEIISGLEAGDRIVTSAHFLIDSESSKTSDFQRMNHESGNAGATPQPQSVWVAARIESIMDNHRMLVLEHDPVDAWQWPAMTMDFSVAANVDLMGLKPDMRLHVEITKQIDNEYIVSQIHRPDATNKMKMDKAEDQEVHSSGHSDIEMDHSQHQSSQNEYLEKSHGQHKAKNHEGMDMDHVQENMEVQP